MLTTCPECQTTFRVDQAQLDARRGMVRCGHCSAIFNAYDTLLPELAPPPSDIQIVAATAILGKRAAEHDKKQTPSEPTFVLEDSDLPLIAKKSVQADRHVAPAAEKRTRQDVFLVDERGNSPDTDSEDDFRVFAEDFSDTSKRGAEDKLDALEAAFAKSLAEPPSQTPHERAVFEPDLELSTEIEATPVADAPQADHAFSVDLPETSDSILLSELHGRKKPMQIQKLWSVLGYSLASLVLLLLFLAQLAYFLRAEIVTYEPGMRLKFEAACKVLGCTVPLSRHLEALRVESSTLETDPEQPSRARLRVSFSNRSNALQAWPHFLLKLTDTRNAPLAQRAFTPQDYLPKDRQTGAGMGPMSEMEFQLALDFGSLSAAGYEVKPHYP